MIISLVLTGLAATVVWEAFLQLVPVHVSVTLRPLLLVALCYGLARLEEGALLPLACAGVVVILRAVLRVEGPDKPSLTLPHLQRTKRPERSGRIPTLP